MHLFRMFEHSIIQEKIRVNSSEAGWKKMSDVTAIKCSLHQQNCRQAGSWWIFFYSLFALYVKWSDDDGMRAIVEETNQILINTYSDSMQRRSRAHSHRSFHYTLFNVHFDCCWLKWNEYISRKKNILYPFHLYVQLLPCCTMYLLVIRQPQKQHANMSTRWFCLWLTLIWSFVCPMCVCVSSRGSLSATQFTHKPLEGHHMYSYTRIHVIRVVIDIIIIIHILAKQPKTRSSFEMLFKTLRL